MDQRQKKRIDEGWVSEHFRRAEFACPCCGVSHIQLRLVDGLEILRKKLGGVPIHINSGYRCPEWNKTIGGASKSQHLEGTAADVVVAGRHPLEVAEAAERVEVFSHGGIGKYSARGFTHLDARYRGPARWGS